MDTGWLTATASRNVAPGDVVWQYEERVYTSDESRAYKDIPNGDHTHKLNAYTFGASVPGDATIVGIQMLVERHAENDEKIKDHGIFLMNGTATKGNDKATADWWPISDATVYYGGAADLWGASWTPAQVNASTFGCAVQAKNHYTSDRRARIDYMSIKIYYSTGETNVDHLMIMGM